MYITTYLFFDGRCEEAIGLYEECFGAEVLFVMRYKDGPPHLVPPNGEELIFHATVKIGETVLNMSDMLDLEPASFTGFGLLIHVETVDRAETIFGKLSIEGQVKLALEPTPWARLYGIVVDKFGVTWKIQVNR